MGEIAIFITVDTEGDNLWAWDPSKTIETNNSKYIGKFQQLCEKYSIPPIYLTNYEMAMSDDFVEFVRDKAKQGKCEVGMHLHAWNSPPIIELKSQYGGNPYIIEYSKQEIYEKHKYLKELITNRIGLSPISYRSGRWATNDDLFDVLEELGFLVDCSVTPGINHKAPGSTIQHANNYRKACRRPYQLRNSLWEIPMTTDIRRSLQGKTFFRKAVNLLRGEERWLRPALQTSEEMLALANDALVNGAQYLMFMIHSSELMPKGSPYCSTEDDVKDYLDRLDSVLNNLSLFGRGYTLKEYYHIKLRKKQ